MTITVQLPDDVATHEQSGREALQALVIEGYKSGVFTQREGAAMFEMHWQDFERLLQQNGVVGGAYDEQNLRDDLATMDTLHVAGKLQRSSS